MIVRTLKRGLARAFFKTGLHHRSDTFEHVDRPAPSVGLKLRIVSFNILAAWLTSLEHIEAVLRRLNADVIALQEVDRQGPNSQMRLLAQALGCSYVYAAAFNFKGGDHGIGVLSRLPILEAQRIELDSPFQSDPRIALELRLGNENFRFTLVTLHADFLPWSARANARALLSPIQTTLNNQAAQGGLMVAGDLNAPPWAPGPRALTAMGLKDLLAEYDEGRTYHLRRLPVRLDYLMADAQLAARVRQAKRVKLFASDHYPVFADLDLGD